MKYLLVITLAVVVFWLWRNNRRSEGRSAHNDSHAHKSAPPGEATEIVECEVCHVHLPRAEALMGPGGVFCSAAHRAQASH